MKSLNLRAKDEINSGENENFTAVNRYEPRQ